MAGTVNHTTNNETAKITDTIYLARDTVMESEERLRREHIALAGTEKLLKRENHGRKQEEHVRNDIRMP